jgi:excisionase family DNA binding protein
MCRETPNFGEIPVPRTSATPIPPRLLRVRDAARYLGISCKAVRALILAGKLKAFQMKTGGNSPLLVDVRDLDRWIEKQKANN